MINKPKIILNVAVVCEESQTVCKAFRELGHNAYSCDLLSCSGGHPEWHFNCDCFEIIENKGGVMQSGETAYVDKWDLLLAFPPCTYLTVSGNSWFNEERHGDVARKRKIDREDAVRFFMSIASIDVEHIAIENPVGVISTRWRKPNQIIQPWMFGDPTSKKTCLWTKNLPLLVPTNIVEPEYIECHSKSNKSGKSRYSGSALLPPSKDRQILRSKTFLGIAEAMATQWSQYLTE